MNTSTSFTIQLLKKQFKQLEESESIEGVSLGLENDNLYVWNVSFAGPVDSLYEGGYFQCQFTFSDDYPNNPPKVKFLTKMWHPNIYPDGKVCISILHSQNDSDIFNDHEPPETKWRPILTPEIILISIISLLVEPNINSAANVDASVQFRDKRQEYQHKVRRLIDEALANL